MVLNNSVLRETVSFLLLTWHTGRVRSTACDTLLHQEVRSFFLISFETTVHSFQGIKFVIAYSTQNSKTAQEIISKTAQQLSAYLALSQLFPLSASTTKKTKTSSFICKRHNCRCSLIPGHSLSSSLVLTLNN